MISYNDYLDKVYGGWIGKCLGGAAGAPVEGRKELIPAESFIEMMRPDIPNDDLDIQILWLEVMKKKGRNITSIDLADAWDERVWYPFNEYGNFLRNYDLGIMPPFSGKFNNRVFSVSEGAPIRSEIWGMLYPGNPEKAAYFARKDAVLDHDRDGVWLEQFYAAIEAQAFYESDIKTLIKNSLIFLPEDSQSNKCVNYVLDSEENFDNWIDARENLLREFAHFDMTNAVVNCGIIIIALLYAQTLEEAINIGFRSGYDTDSTCATIGAILGIIYGEKEIPEKMKELISSDLVIGIDVVREDPSIIAFSKDVCNLGERIVVPLDTEKLKSNFELNIKYSGNPCFDKNNECAFSIILTNSTSVDVTGSLEFSKIPLGIELMIESSLMTIPANSEVEIKNKANCMHVDKLAKKNIFEITFNDHTEKFGIAGYNFWKCAGPFVEAIDKLEPDWVFDKNDHSLNLLPTMEAGENNFADFDKEYINETQIAQSILENSTYEVFGQEDTIPLQEVLNFQGQGCIYLNQTINLSREEELWLVIGNNDAFKLWINDELVLEKNEIRMWSPYNNYQLCKFKEGRNTISLKLIRNTDKFDFSIAPRIHDGEFFHVKRWFIDYSVER